MSEAYDVDAEMVSQRANEKAEIAARIELKINEISSIQKEFSALLTRQKEEIGGLETGFKAADANMKIHHSRFIDALSRIPIPSFLDKILKGIVLCLPIVAVIMCIVSFLLYLFIMSPVYSFPPDWDDLLWYS